MAGLKRITPRMVLRFTQIDYEREMALVAVIPTGTGETQIAVARFVNDRDDRTCEFAIVVADEWHNKGIATELLRRLIAIARDRRLERMEGIVLRENKGMIGLARSLGFDLHAVPDDPLLVSVSLQL